MTQINTFFVPLSGGDAAQAELNAFMRGRRVLQIDKSFTGNGWAFCVEWLDGAAGGGSGRPFPKRVDYRETLDPETFARFARLRERRKAISAEDGVPPYMVMTDAQMAEAVKDGVPTIETLRTIEGFGEARLAKYAARLLAGDKEG